MTFAEVAKMYLALENLYYDIKSHIEHKTPTSFIYLDEAYNVLDMFREEMEREITNDPKTTR